jgi:hypothetical protein
MRCQTLIRVGLILLVTLLASLSCSTVGSQEMPKEYQEALNIVGKTGDYSANVLKANIPRNDLSVRIAGHATPTPFGFGGWLAMTRGTDGMDVLMGDLVLTQEEVNPEMSALLEHGLEVTALHNHFFFEEPRLFYMHVHGHGAAGIGFDWERLGGGNSTGSETGSRYDSTGQNCGPQG